MSNRAKKTYLVGDGHPTGTKAYILWDPVGDKLITSRDVIPRETETLETAHQPDPEDLDLIEEEEEDIQMTPKIRMQNS